MIECCDVVDGLSGLTNESADVVLVDPPYNIGKDFGVTKDRLSVTQYIEWCDKWLTECVRVLKSTGTIYDYGFPEILAHLSVRFPLPHRWLTWHYTNKTTPGNKFWQRSFESILCGWKDEKARIFNVDDVREPYTKAFLKNAAGKVRKSTPGRFGNTETVYNAHEGGALPRDVICCPALAGGAGLAERWFLCKTCDVVLPNKKKKEHETHELVIHPTQKPDCITRKLLSATKPKEGGMVVIPFVGSGAECIVAQDLGYSFFGFEINPDYARIASVITKVHNNEQRQFVQEV